jgi:ABC-type branched-subunit amino acid transport system substrate-binding protein
LVASQPFEEGATDFTSEILKLKNAGAQAAVLQVYGPDESNIIHQMSALKVKMPLASAEDTPYPFVVNKQTGPGINGIYFYSDYIHGTGKQPLSQFEQEFNKLYPGRVPMDIDWEGYLAMQVLMHALQQPGAASGGTALQKALQQTNLSMGQLPTLTFLPNGDQKQTLTYVGRVLNMKPVFEKLLIEPRTSFPDWK